MVMALVLSKVRADAVPANPSTRGARKEVNNASTPCQSARAASINTNFKVSAHHEQRFTTAYAS